jgi:hypothetical protein
MAGTTSVSSRSIAAAGQVEHPRGAQGQQQTQAKLQTAQPVLHAIGTTGGNMPPQSNQLQQPREAPPWATPNAASTKAADSPQRQAAADERRTSIWRALGTVGVQKTARAKEKAKQKWNANRSAALLFVCDA